MILRVPFLVLTFIVFFCDPSSALICGGSTIKMQVCKRCTYPGRLIVKKDTPCERFLNIGGNLVLLDSKITKRPSHGSAGVSSFNYAYSPAKGYVGQDQFTLNWTLLRDNEVYVTFIEITVDVVP